MIASSRCYRPPLALLCFGIFSACIYAPGLSGDSSNGSTGSTGDSGGQSSTGAPDASTGTPKPCEETRSFTEAVCFCPGLENGCTNCMTPVSVCEEASCPPPVTWCAELSFESECTVRSFAVSFAVDHFSAGSLTLSLRRKDAPADEVKLIDRPGVSPQTMDGTLAEYSPDHPVTVIWPGAAADPDKLGECWPLDGKQVCGSTDVAGCSEVTEACRFRPSDDSPGRLMDAPMKGDWSLCITHWTSQDYVAVKQLDVTLRDFP